MPVNRLAIDLSDSTIRLTEGMLFGEVRFGETPSPENSVVEGRIQDPQAIGKAIRDLAAEVGVHETRALVASNDRISAFRLLNLPDRKSERQVESMMRRELPLPHDRLILHWVDLSHQKGGQGVFAVASDKLMIDGIAEAVRASGLQPLAMEPRSLCLTRAAGLPNCVIIDVHETDAAAVVVQDWLPRLHHYFEITNDGSKALVGSLSSGVRSAMAFFQSRNRELQADVDRPVIITGERAVEPALLKSFAETLGRPVENAARPSCMPASLPTPAYLACAGLMMRRS
jgi:hypothetical protein